MHSRPFVGSSTRRCPGPVGGGAPPPGATAICRDGEYSFSTHHSGTCSRHGGVSTVAGRTDADRCPIWNVGFTSSFLPTQYEPNFAHSTRLSRKVTRPLRTAEAADRIALHLSRHLQQSLESIADSERVRVGIEVARDLIARLAEILKSDNSESPIEPGEVLHAILERRPDGRPERIAEPLIPLLDTTLLTNAPGEPGLLHQLDAEIGSADAIDVVMAFIRRSGINPLLSSLRRHCESGRPLRMLTTIYTGSTEKRALEQLERYWRSDTHLIRRQHDPSARQGVDLPPPLRFLDGLRGLVEPHPLCPAHRP